MVPHIAAGINLNLPIVGQLMRGAGAYFIRRTFSGNELYTSVFKEYLHSLLSRISHSNTLLKADVHAQVCYCHLKKACCR